MDLHNLDYRRCGGQISLLELALCEIPMTIGALFVAFCQYLIAHIRGFLGLLSIPNIRQIGQHYDRTDTVMSNKHKKF